MLEFFSKLLDSSDWPPRWHCGRWTEFRKVELELRNMNETELSSPIKETIFRIAQEQLSNIVKHAKAGKILMRVYNDPWSVHMVIRDNGIGFDLQQKRKGIGITNILNRVESYNGRADFISEPGQGCTLSVSIPFQSS